MPSEKFPHLLPKNYLLAIGSLSTHYGYLESVLEISIWAFLGLNRSKGALVTTHLNMKLRQDIFYSLLRNRYDEEDPHFVYFKQLHDKLEELRVERNKVIHGFYGFTKRGSPKVMRTTAKRELQDRIFKLSLEEINTVTYEIWSTVSEFMDKLEQEFPSYAFPWKRKYSAPAEE